MTDVFLLACLALPVVLGLRRPRLWPALLITVALANLLVFGGTARFFWTIHRSLEPLSPLAWVLPVARWRSSF